LPQANEIRAVIRIEPDSRRGASIRFSAAMRSVADFAGVILGRRLPHDHIARSNPSSKQRILAGIV